MKQYKIFAFGEKIFGCKEVQENGLTLLIGKFKGKRKQYTFIKNDKDVEIN